MKNEKETWEAPKVVSDLDINETAGKPNPGNDGFTVKGISGS